MCNPRLKLRFRTTPETIIALSVVTSPWSAPIVKHSPLLAALANVVAECCWLVVKLAAQPLHLSVGNGASISQDGNGFDQKMFHGFLWEPWG